MEMGPRLKRTLLEPGRSGVIGAAVERSTMIHAAGGTSSSSAAHRISIVFLRAFRNVLTLQLKT
jgi:hypothetical protein